jgi:hypothetical protein
VDVPRDPGLLGVVCKLWALDCGLWSGNRGGCKRGREIRSTFLGYAVEVLMFGLVSLVGDGLLGRQDAKRLPRRRMCTWCSRSHTKISDRLDNPDCVDVS